MHTALRRSKTAHALMKHDSKQQIHEHEALLPFLELCAESKQGKIKPMHVAERDPKPVLFRWGEFARDLGPRDGFSPCWKMPT